jgi:hypothetical protein
MFNVLLPWTMAPGVFVIRSHICNWVPLKLLLKSGHLKISAMEQHPLQNEKRCLNTNIYSHLHTSGGQNSYLNLNVVHFFNTSGN